MQLKDLAAHLNANADRQEKIIAEIQALKNALEFTEIPPAAEAALNRLDGLIEQADNLNEDAGDAV